MNPEPPQLGPGGERLDQVLPTWFRCLAGEAELLLADEPTSMLDVSVRAGIIATLQGLRDHFSLGVLLITHDIGEAFRLCDRLIVLLEGRIVEAGPARQVVLSPTHPYTRALLAAADDPLGVSEPELSHDRHRG